MAREATAPELTKFRSDGQATELYCAFRIPTTIYTARLNGAPTSNDMVAEITYDGGVGTLANVKDDMTMYVGTAAGKHDLGYARIRKTPTSTIFYIAEGSDIAWADNCYLTVIDDYDLWAKHIHIDGTTPKMDYDVAYSDQHLNFLPVPMMGSHRVVKMTGASVTVQLGAEDGYDSWVHGSTISTYAWSIPDATDISDATVARPVAEFNTFGWHACYLTVTAANGKSKQGVRYVYVWDKDHMPTEVFKMGSMDEDFSEGGFNLDIEMPLDADTDTITERALCIVFAVDYYGTGDDQAEGSIGAVAGCENIVAVGRIESESISFNALAGKVNFKIAGYQQFFKLIKGFPSGLQMQNTATKWTDMPELSVDRALWHILEWRCTATRIMDIALTGDTLYASELASPATNIWGQMEEFAFATILANIHVDSYGRLFAEIDPLLIPVEDRSYPTVMIITKDDYIEEISLERVTLTKTSQINLSGVHVNLGGTGLAFFSLSPGHVFSRHGDIETIDKLLLEDQAHANTKAGLIYAARNNEFPRLTMKLRANNRLLTCFPNQAISYTLEETDTPRAIAFTKKFVPRRRRLSFDNAVGFLATEIEFEAVTIEAISTNGDVPGSSEFTFPPSDGYSSTPLTGFILPTTLPVLSVDAPKKVLVHDYDLKGLLVSSDFYADDPNWYTVNSGLSTTQYKNINKIVICPNGAIYVAYRYGSNDCFIARAPYVGGTFTVIEDATSICIKMGFTGVGDVNHAKVVGIECNPLLPEDVIYIIGVTTVALDDPGMARHGDGTTWTDGYTWLQIVLASLSYGFGNWLVSYSTWAGPPQVAKGTLSSDGVTFTPIGSYWHYRMIWHKRVSTTGKTIHWYDELTLGKLRIGTDNLASYIDIGGDVNAIESDESAIAIDPSGQFMLASYDTPYKGKSTDGGATFSDISPLPYIGNNWRWAFAGLTATESRWIAGGSYLYYTKDFWASSINKQGNLPLLSPLYKINAIKVLEY